MTKKLLEIKSPCPELEPALADFFLSICNDGDNKNFHPHPLTPEEANRLCQYDGKDLYYLLTEGQRVLGYGILRGWDEDYDIPSLGIAIRSSDRGCGLAKLLMKYLHTAARRNGAKKVILKVNKDNLAARNLYEKLGYKFEEISKTQLIGSINL